MALKRTLVAVIAFASLASTASAHNINPHLLPPVDVRHPEIVDGRAPRDGYRPLELVPEPDSYQLYPPRLPLNFQLPRQEHNPIPFYASEPIPYLKAPHEHQDPNFYQVPLPAQDLVAPIETVWNPENDPALYYEVPSVITRQELPTNAYPKKYNKEIHSKDKPYSAKPKQEIVLEPIDGKQYDSKQKELLKAFQQIAKKENQKDIKANKVNNNTKTNDTEQQTAGTAVERDESRPAVDAEINASSENYDKGLDAKLTSSLGIPSSHADSSDGDRINFHMVGHDGPHSYKWGFDTGKGQNRQFRYEEKDGTGLVKGHYGFYDKNGKLQIVHYDSHPHGGYHAEGNFGKV